MAYEVKEIFYTLQGEGAQTGRPSVFCRFAGCNLWSGHEADRRNAVCSFCDTDFIGSNGPGGGMFETASELAQQITQTWPVVQFSQQDHAPFVVFTGGEPLLQLDSELLCQIKNFGFEIAVETNGSLPVPSEVDWITVSPKPNAPLIQTTGNELKLVYPQELSPKSLEHLQFDLFYLSPLVSSDPRETEENTKLTLEYCMQHPLWRLTMQSHRIWGLP